MKSRSINCLLVLLTFAPTLLWAAPTWELKLPATDTKISTWLDSVGWEEQRGDADRWLVTGGVLRTVQRKDSTTIGSKRGFPLRPNQSLELSFRVLEKPAGANLARKNKEDSALRVFVLFDKGGGIFSPPRTLGYAVGEAEPLETVLTSQRFDDVKFIIVASGPADPTKWIDLKRDVAADYRKAFGEAPPAIKAIAIKSDGNNLDANASAEIRWLRLSEAQ